MGTNIKLMNKSMAQDLPKIFLFAKNNIPTFDTLKDGVAWRVIEDSSNEIDIHVTDNYSIRATWLDGTCSTVITRVSFGKKISITEDATGITLKECGNASDTKSIDVLVNVHMAGDFTIELLLDNKVLMSQKNMKYDQVAKFVQPTKMYVGFAKDAQEGESLKKINILSKDFGECNLNELRNITLNSTGNAQDGYIFKIDDWK